MRDTGVGIPADELPKLFDRFHRVEGARGRSFEGSGIGLALVQELVRQHGGEISVESEVGRGSAFTVAVPLGASHLPPERVEVAQDDAPVAVRAQSFVEEALRWLPGGAGADILLEAGADASRAACAAPVAAPSGDASCWPTTTPICAPISRACSTDRGYEVEAAVDGDGGAGVGPRDPAGPPGHRRDDAAARRLWPPARVREDPELRDLPVVMLSARAGEEAKVEGLDAGADDYLTKPFSARELLARVAAVIAMARSAARRQRPSGPARLWRTNRPSGSSSRSTPVRSSEPGCGTSKTIVWSATNVSPARSASIRNYAAGACR